MAIRLETAQLLLTAAKVIEEMGEMRRSGALWMENMFVIGLCIYSARHQKSVDV